MKQRTRLHERHTKADKIGIVIRFSKNHYGEVPMWLGHNSKGSGYRITKKLDEKAL